MVSINKEIALVCPHDRMTGHFREVRPDLRSNSPEQVLPHKIICIGWLPLTQDLQIKSGDKMCLGSDVYGCVRIKGENVKTKDI